MDSKKELCYVLGISQISEKIKAAPQDLQKALRGELILPPQLGRDVVCVRPQDLPPRQGLSKKEGQARLLHDLAHIELQAMELGLRTLIEYPEAPARFRSELVELTLAECGHLKLCLEELEALGFRWGIWPVHLTLWQSVRSGESFLDRLFIVHRYLEGAGLDAGSALLKKLNGVCNPGLKRVVQTIVNEEIGHVEFGNRWYHDLVKEATEESQAREVTNRYEKLKTQLPPKTVEWNLALRLESGFKQEELKALEASVSA